MPITDLTGTKWLINSIVCPAGYGRFDNANIEVYLDEEGTELPPYGPYGSFLWIGWVYNLAHEKFIAVESVEAYMYGGGTLVEGYYVTFVSGTDLTNTDLISWVITHATQIVEPSGYTITIDGVAYSADEGDLLVINQTGLYNSTKSSQIYTFVSTGGRFLGFNTASGQSSPSIGYGILDTFTALEDLVLYSVEQQPAKTFDLSTLELSSGDHTITVKSTASGYGDSVASNIITYNTSSGGAILRIYDAAALAEVFEVYSDGVKVAEAPIESAPDNAILDNGGNYIKGI